MTDKQKRVAAVLAGGQARRMHGKDKGLIEYQGKPMIEHAIARLEPQCDEIIINANRNLDHYRQYGWPVIIDEPFDEVVLSERYRAEFRGPLAGMYSVMQHVQHNIHQYQCQYVSFVPCDAPLLPADIIERMQSKAVELKADIAVPFTNGRIQPVFATISLDLLPDLYYFIEQEGRKIDEWFDRHYWVQVDFNKDAPAFANLNTPQDLMLDAQALQARI